MTRRSASLLVLVAGIGAAAVGMGLVAARSAGHSAPPAPPPPPALAPAPAQLPAIDAGLANQSRAEASESQLRFEPAALDLGLAAAGSTVRGEAWIVNGGSEPAMLEHVKGSCGCTKIEAASGPLAPGERRQVSFVVTATGAAGKSRNLTVIATVADRAPLKLPVTLRTVAPEGASAVDATASEE